MLYQLLLFLHVIFASIWVGGHLVLSLGFLPKAIKNKDLSIILNFEQIYEKMGIPSLIGQVITGIILSIYKVSEFQELFNWHTFYGRHFILKLLLLLLTILLAIHARLKIIPTLTIQKLPLLALHIVGVTIVGILFVIVGLSFRLNLFF